MAVFKVTTPLDFWKEVVKTRTCWFWSKAAVVLFKNKKTTPKRLAFELHHKKKLKTRFVLVLQTCGNLNCVNPDHLRSGTQKDVPSRKSVPEDFWKRINKNGPVIHKKLGRCWNWTGGTYKKDGYGQVHYQGAAFVASRLAWTLERSEIPPDTLVCHKCDNRLCVRPSHLFLGSNKDNTQDMINKGRYVSNGKYIRTKAHRKAISDRMKGQHYTLGRKHSEATKKKIHETRVARGLNKPLSKQHRAAISKSLLGNTRAHDAHVKKSAA